MELFFYSQFGQAETDMYGSKDFIKSKRELSLLSAVVKQIKRFQAIKRQEKFS